jgi:hypothetical protein
MCSRDQGGRWSGRGAFRFCAGLIILGGAYPAASSCVPPHCEPPITNYILSCHASIANTPQPVDTSPVCVGSAMEFNIPVLTADLGGYLIRRYKVRRKAHCREPGNVVDCQEAVLPQPIVYTWSIWQGTNQRGNGSGPVAVYYPASPGSYTCRFVTHVTRAICPPNPRSWTTTVTRAAYEVQVTGAVTRLCVGQTIGLSALHARGPVTWASSAPAVATVAAGQVTGLAPGAAVISATDSNGCSDSISVTVLKIDMITPAGDPVNAAVQSGDGQNEFTYSTASPGVLTMNLKARVTPSGMASQIKDQCLFTVDTIAGSTLTWDAANPGGKPTASGDDLLATVTFTGLPANNTALGSKKAAIHFNASKQDEENCEVFFPRDVANHPGGVAADPNWFYYWGQVYVNANVQYLAAAGVGRTPAMTAWTYSAVPSKTLIEIGSGHPAKYKSYGIGEEASGIDRYIMTVIHEEKHVAQIAAADALLPTSGADSFRFGWSWNQATHNHWTKGPDGQWGVAGVDDDGNSTVDDAAVVPPFEPGNGDDISLDHATWPWWPNTWTLPGGVYATIHPIEGEAVKAADDAMNENDYAPQDWADPGKNHKTVNKWDD